MKKTIIRIILVLAVICTVVFLWHKSGTVKHNQIKIFFSIYDSDERFPALILEKAQNYAKEKGIEIKIGDAEKSKDKQQQDIENAKRDGYNAIICIPGNNDTGYKVSEKSKVPIVFVNNNPGQDVLKSNKVIYVGTDEKEAGSLQAQFVSYYFKDKLKEDNADKRGLKIVLLKGTYGQDATVNRTKAVKEYFRNSNYNVDYVFEDFSNWKKENAKNKFEVFLQSKQDFDCVICNNDEMATGVIEAYKEYNIDFDEHPIIGIDATSEGCTAIKNNELKFSVYQSAEGEAEYAIDAAMKLCNHGTICTIPYVDSDNKNIWVPSEKVGINNYNDYN